MVADQMRGRVAEDGGAGDLSAVPMTIEWHVSARGLCTRCGHGHPGVIRWDYGDLATLGVF